MTRADPVAEPHDHRNKREGDRGVGQRHEAFPDRLHLLRAHLDLALREAVVRGKAVDLSRKEFDLLALLVSESGHVVTRQKCMERIWQDRKMGDSRTLDTHVKRLRKKIELNPADPEHVLTVRGIGYRFVASPEV